MGHLIIEMTFQIKQTPWLSAWLFSVDSKMALKGPTDPRNGQFSKYGAILVAEIHEPRWIRVRSDSTTYRAVE